MLTESFEVIEKPVLTQRVIMIIRVYIAFGILLDARIPQ